MSRALVVPHHHENLDFLKEWPSFEKDFDTIYIVWDKNDIKDEWVTVKWDNLVFYDHHSIEEKIGSKEWIIPRSDSSIRSFGYYLAWKDGHKTIFTLDNDCKPKLNSKGNYWVDEHEQALKKSASTKWWTTGPTNHLRTRGLPYNIQEGDRIMLSHGTWENNPDYDAIQSISEEKVYITEKDYVSELIPKGYFFPMCGMNLAWNRNITPLMYFGLQGTKYPYTRFDDIWAGLFIKKVLDYLNMGVYTGLGVVNHSRQSNAYENLIKEAPGIRENETLWKRIDEVIIPKKYDTPVTAYEYLIKNIDFSGLPNQEYWKELYSATLCWLELFK